MKTNEYEEEVRTVRIFRDKETGNIVREYLEDEDGHFHGTDDRPAVQWFDAKTGRRTQAEYRTHSILNRDEKKGPAVQRWDAETGNLIYEEYKMDGEGHRSGKKAAVIYYDRNTGEVIEEIFMKNGVDIDPKTGQPRWDDPTIDNMTPEPL